MSILGVVLAVTLALAGFMANQSHERDQLQKQRDREEIQKLFEKKLASEAIKDSPCGEYSGTLWSDEKLVSVFHQRREERFNFKHIEGPWYLFVAFGTYQMVGALPVNDEQMKTIEEYNRKRLGAESKP